MSKTETIVQDRKGNNVMTNQFIKTFFMNFKVSIVKNSIPTKISGENDYELQIWMVQPPHIKAYLCEKGLSNPVTSSSMLLGDDNSGTNEILEEEPNAGTSKLYQLIEFINSQNSIYVLGGVEY